MVSGKGMVLILVLALVMVPLISSQEIYKRGEEIDLKQPCYNNGTYCESTAACNITVTRIFPNNTLMFDNQLMTNQIAYHNYTVASIETGILGEYVYDISCCQGDVCDASSFEFEITGSGGGFTTQTVQFYIGVMFVLVFLFVVCMVGIRSLPNGNTMESDGRIISISRLKYLRYVLASIGWGILVSMAYLALNIAEAYLFSGIVVGIFRMIFVFLMISAIVGVPIILIYMISSFVQDQMVKRYIERGLM